MVLLLTLSPSRSAPLRSPLTTNSGPITLPRFSLSAPCAPPMRSRRASPIPSSSFTTLRLRRLGSFFFLSPPSLHPPRSLIPLSLPLFLRPTLVFPGP